MKACLIIITLAIVIGSWAAIGDKAPTPLPFVTPRGWPAPVYDFKHNPLTKEGFELGRKLFYDGRLSRDGNFSCAGCHQQFGAFATYDHPLSHGYNNTLTSRNAPALQNLAWQKELMWDGSIHSLDQQPLIPLTAPNEMAETTGNILRKLNADTGYKRLFRAAFGEGAISIARMNRALSQFMVMLVSSNSKYDRVMRGEDSFILPEQLGHAIFNSKCAGCHAAPFFTDFSYRNTGMPSDNSIPDMGRMKVTGRAGDSLKFRVPSLRNVAVSFPYGHDGRFFSLAEVFEHYRKKLVAGPQTDSLVRHTIALSNFEIGQLTAFLYTLTDTGFLKNPAFAPPGYEITPAFIHQH